MALYTTGLQTCHFSPFLVKGYILKYLTDNFLDLSLDGSVFGRYLNSRWRHQHSNKCYDQVPAHLVIGNFALIYPLHRPF